MKKLLLIITVLVALIVSSTLYAMFVREDLTISKVQAKERYSRLSSHFLQWRGAELHYTDEGDGPTVLMIHGLGGNFTNFDSLATIMKSSYRIIRFDLPGFGLSDLPATDETPSELYRAYFDFMLDTLKLDSLYVIGNSMGGWMSWELAYNKPEKVKKLVLIGSAGYEMEKVKANLSGLSYLNNAIVKQIAERGIPFAVSLRSAKRMISEWEEPNIDATVINNGLINRKGNLWNLITLGNSGVLPDTNKITQIQCPSLVIWGKNDIIVPYEHAAKFKRDLANSTMIVYDTCGHIPQMEYPQRVAGEIERFFN